MNPSFLPFSLLFATIFVRRRIRRKRRRYILDYSINCLNFISLFLLECAFVVRAETNIFFVLSFPGQQGGGGEEVNSSNCNNNNNKNNKNNIRPGTTIRKQRTHTKDSFLFLWRKKEETRHENLPPLLCKRSRLRPTPQKKKLNKMYIFLAQLLRISKEGGGCLSISMWMTMMMCASQPAYQAAYMMKIEINKKNQNKSDEATHVWMQMRKMRIIKENRAFGVTKNSGFPSAKSRRTFFGPHTCTGNIP